MAETCPFVLADPVATDRAVADSLRSARTVLGARNGAEALQLIRSHRPQVVMFVFDLDDMTGAELCRQVRSDPETRTTSLLFVTDHGRDEHIDLCMAAGANDIIFRPVDASDLRSRVERFESVPLRKELRTLTKVEIFSPTEPAVLLIGHSVNVSSTGMLLEVNRLLSPGTTVRLTFYLPDDPQLLTVDAMVFRAEFDGPTARYGVQFEGLSADDRERIDGYVQRQREAS
jgi:CheY-like chemotaxis protein